MFQNAAIDIAIGLVLMYLVLSLVCTVINEFIATRLDLRSKALAAGLQEILDDPVVRNAFYDHGLITSTRNALTKIGQASLMGGASAAQSVPQHPSYISSETFVLALVGSLTGERLAQGQAVPGFADVQSAIQNLPPSRIKSALLASLMTASSDFDAFRKSVATWFDDSMDRVGGAYKRHLKLISIIAGCVVAVVMNADTFEVSKALWSDSALRAQMVQAADATVKAGLPAPPETPPPTPTAPSVTAPPPTPPAAAAPTTTLPTEAAPKTPTDIESSFKLANEKLRPLPLGWPLCTAARAATAANTTSTLAATSARECPKADDGLAWAWFLSVKVFGWFMTGLALSLGAPFWFDLLSKFINIRGAGVKPARRT
jgi:hypothetical protein